MANAPYQAAHEKGNTQMDAIGTDVVNNVFSLADENMTYHVTETSGYTRTTRQG